MRAARGRRGLGPRLIAVAVVVVSAALAAGCGSSADEDAMLTIYLSAPLSGPRAADGRDVADGAELALEDAGGEAGGVEVRLEVLDDAAAGGWDAATTGANARAATEDSTAIAFVGDLDSGASRTSIPITNQAGLLQVSPGAGAEDLTRDSVGSGAVPDLQASGDRTFARVIPSDRAQGEAAAVWMAGEGISTVTVADDGSDYAAALVAGLEAPADAPAITGDGQALFQATESPGLPEGGGTGERGIYGTDAQLPAGGDVQFAGSRSTPVRLVSAALDPSQLPPAAGDFLAAFGERYGREPGRYAAYGYEATAATLAAIDDAEDPTDRGDVVDAFFAIEDRESILGAYSIDEVGNTTLGSLGAYEVGRSGEPRPVSEPITLP